MEGGNNIRRSVNVIGKGKGKGNVNVRCLDEGRIVWRTVG